MNTKYFVCSFFTFTRSLGNGERIDMVDLLGQRKGKIVRSKRKDTRRKMMDIAMLIIDLQKGILASEESKETVRDAVEYINEVSGYFRKAGKPVIVIQDREVGEGPGSEGYELIDELEVEETDIQVSKVHSNSFYETQLETILHELGVEFLVISGFAAEYCVLFTYNGARERGFGASLLQHGIVGMTKKGVRDTQIVRPVISYEALKFFLKGSE